MWRALREAGYPICSSWIDEAGPGETSDLSELWTRIQAEVTGSIGLVFYAEPSDLPLKGAYVEVGMALSAGLPVVVVLWGFSSDEEGRVGSWIRHPGVSRAATPALALSWLLDPAAPAGLPTSIMRHP